MEQATKSEVDSIPEPVSIASPDSTGWSSDSLINAWARIASQSTGDVGVDAIHLESGRRAGLNEQQRFPMASVYKVPIAIEVLGRRDEGALSLADSITVDSRDFVGGANPLATAAGGRPVTLTIERLLDYMVRESDNTATDALLRVVGGPAVVEGRMRRLGIEAIDVNRYEVEIFAEARGGADPGAADSRNTATPAALVDLLTLVQRGEHMSAASRRLLLELLTSTTIGADRIKGLLPPGTVVAHKTGTFGAVTNDVGIMTLPDGTHLAIAVFLRAPGTRLVDRERTIAQIARAAYDAFAPSEAAPRTRPRRRAVHLTTRAGATEIVVETVTGSPVSRAHASRAQRKPAKI